MAGITARASGNITVVKHSVRPVTARCMTEFAIVAIGRIVWRSRRINTFCCARVVTTRISAVVYDARVIHEIVEEANSVWCYIRRRMARATIGGGNWMSPGWRCRCHRKCAHQHIGSIMTRGTIV